METRSIIVLVTWICVTILSVIIIWVTHQLELWNAIFILLLLGIAFSITFAIPFGLPEIEQPAKRVEEQLTKISRQLQELKQKVDYIKKQLEE
jgi:uncharacterized membrane protein YgaE (UPF0421/DUF939 family)